MEIYEKNTVLIMMPQVKKLDQVFLHFSLLLIQTSIAISDIRIYIGFCGLWIIQNKSSTYIIMITFLVYVIRLHTE